MTKPILALVCFFLLNISYSIAQTEQENSDVWSEKYFTRWGDGDKQFTPKELDLFQAHFYFSDNGFGSHHKKNYTTLVIDNVNAYELQNRIHNFFLKKFPLSNDFIAIVPQTSITINLIINNCLSYDLEEFDIEFTFNIEMKDNKLKFNAPQIINVWHLTDFGRLKLNANTVYSIYKKQPFQLSTLNFYFNNLIDDIYDAVTQTSNDDDW